MTQKCLCACVCGVCMCGVCGSNFKAKIVCGYMHCICMTHCVQHSPNKISGGKQPCFSFL